MKRVKALLILFTASVLLTSCGSDSSSSNNNGFFSPNGSKNSYTSESEYQLYGQLASAFQCRTGQRKSQDIEAHVQGASSQTTIGGNFQNGSMPG